MAFTGEKAASELAALRVVVKQLLQLTRDQALTAEFVEKMTEQGLKMLDKTDYWGVTDAQRQTFVNDSRDSYLEMFSGLRR